LSLVSWHSKKRTIITQSSIEVEHQALANTTSELLWLRWLREDMEVHQRSGTLIHYHNRSAIQIAHNDVFHEQTKHIEIDYHFIRFDILHGIVRLVSTSSTKQIDDVFTKTHPPRHFLDLFSKLKLISFKSP